MISIVINSDTRAGFMEQVSTQGKMFEGTRSLDYLTYGVRNKREFFKNYDVELTLFIDLHERLPQETETELLNMLHNGEIQNLVFNNHCEYLHDSEYFPKFNDINYINALALARGEYIVHFDNDMAAFLGDENVIKEWFQMLDDGKYDYISYPSAHSPLPIYDPSFDYVWASTRFFITKNFDYSEVKKCLQDNEYLYSKYGDRQRKCPWTEHILGLTAKKGVFYPPLDLNRCMVFSWSNYISGTYEKMNQLNYNQKKSLVQTLGGINYPCDVRMREVTIK